MMYVFMITCENMLHPAIVNTNLHGITFQDKKIKILEEKISLLQKAKCKSIVIVIYDVILEEIQSGRLLLQTFLQYS